VEDEVKDVKEERRDPEGKPLRESVDLDAWEPQLPPADFAARVLDRVLAEERSARVGEARETKEVAVAAPAPSSLGGRRWLRRAAGGAGALVLAAAILVRVTAVPAHGEAIARDRVEVQIGNRATAVLEPGASVTWSGDDVVQSRGDVFYRVERGARFTVHTPAGDVEVKGTCFTVKVRPIGKEEDRDMVKRDVKAGAIGAGLSALAFVAVYEGKVAVSHAGERVELRAGESAQTGPNGARVMGHAAAGEKAFDETVSTADGDDPLGAANKNLVQQVSDYRARLEAISAQKTELEVKLKKTEASLAASQDGSAAAVKHDFDLSQEDWKDLATDGTIKYQMPCFRKDGWTPSPDTLNALGLAPQDAATLKSVYAHSNQRVWAAVKPLCAQVLGSAEVAEKVGPDTCIHLVVDIENKRDGEAAQQARRQVGEIRAGMRPMPGPNEPVSPVLKLFLATTGEGSSFEAELAQSFGPEEAHRIRFSDEMCMGTSTFGGSRHRR
jgi:hypothetical protein